MAGIDNNTLLYLRGDSFKDLSPSNVTITNNGVTLVDNKLNFDGVNDLLSIPNDVIDLDNDFTIEFYIHINNSSGYKTILGNGASNSSSYQGITLYVDNSNTLGCEFGFTSNKYQFKINTSEHINSLAHIAFVKNGSNYTFFVNGIMKSSYSNSSSIIKNSQPFLFGKNRDNDTYLNMELCNVRISDIARYTEDFIPQTQPYNSISIDVTNKTATQIDFNISKLGQETINKVEVLVNNAVSETYIDNYDAISYIIDKKLVGIGDNKITIRVTYDDNYMEEEVLTHAVTINKLPTSSSLKELIDRQELLTNNIEVQKNTLKSILESKNVEIAEDEDIMSILIDKVNELEDAHSPLYLYNEGDECVDVTGGWVESYRRTQQGVPEWEKSSTGLVMRFPASSYGAVIKLKLCPNNAIDLTKYSKVCYEVSSSGGSSTYVWVSGYIDNSKGVEIDDVANYSNIGGYNGIFKVDISNVTDKKYVVAYGQINGSSSITPSFMVTFKKIWLEK